jgi:hypothetical protein
MQVGPWPDNNLEVYTPDPIPADDPLYRDLAWWWLALDHLAGAPRAYNAAGAGTGTFVNAPTWARSRDGMALKFTNASSQYVNLNTAPIFNNNAAASVSLWFASTSATLSINLYCEGQSATNSQFMIFRINTTTAGNLTGSIRDVPLTNASVDSTGVTTNDGRLHHAGLVSTGAGGTIAIYLDGVACGSTANTCGTNMGFNTSTIGCLLRNSGALQYFDGTIRDVKGWSRPITAAQMRADYDNGRSGYANVLNRIRPSFDLYPAPAAAGKVPIHLFFPIRSGI